MTRETLPEGKDAHLLIHVKFASPENGHGQQLSPSQKVLGVIFVNLSYMNKPIEVEYGVEGSWMSVEEVFVPHQVVV